MAQIITGEPDLGKIAYEAYYDATTGVSLVTGEQLLPWVRLSYTVQQAWRCAGRAAGNRVLSRLEEVVRETW